MPEKTDRVRHYWWHGTDLLQFVFNFGRYAFMCGIENIRVEFWPHEELDGSRGVLKIVDTRDDEVLGSYNWSHVCPPDCS